MDATNCSSPPSTEHASRSSTRPERTKNRPEEPEGWKATRTQQHCTHRTRSFDQGRDDQKEGKQLAAITPKASNAVPSLEGRSLHPTHSKPSNGKQLLDAQTPRHGTNLPQVREPHSQRLHTRTTDPQRPREPASNRKAKHTWIARATNTTGTPRTQLAGGRSPHPATTPRTATPGSPCTRHPTTKRHRGKAESWMLVTTSRLCRRPTHAWTQLHQPAPTLRQQDRTRMTLPA